MISLRLTGQLTLAVVTALRFCFVSLWERTEVRVNLSRLPRPSPFSFDGVYPERSRRAQDRLPKGEGGIGSTLLVP